MFLIAHHHHHLYLGAMQLLTSFFYNLCNAIDSPIFLTETQWHQLDNVLTITYGIYEGACSVTSVI